MAEKARRFPLGMARLVAERLADRLGPPRAERMEVRGSIHRGSPEVGDIELLYIPRFEERQVRTLQASMFTGAMETQWVDLVDREIRDLMMHGILVNRRKRDGSLVGYGEENKFLVHMATGLGVDVFRTEARWWGMASIVRTGPAGWNVAMMHRFRMLGMEGHAYGGVTRGLRTLECLDEETVFRLLEFPYVAPEVRADPNVIRALASLREAKELEGEEAR